MRRPAEILETVELSPTRPFLAFRQPTLASASLKRTFCRAFPPRLSRVEHLIPLPSADPFDEYSVQDGMAY